MDKVLCFKIVCRINCEVFVEWVRIIRIKVVDIRGQVDVYLGDIFWL